MKKRTLMIHADDAGLSRSTNAAIIRALKEGHVNSYSIMVPCAYLDEIAEFAANHSQYDYGIHLTLTCEWENRRYGPVLPVSDVPSLVDEQGFFHKTYEEFDANASPADVKKELTAQIDRALALGLRPSHLDTHMFVLYRSDAFVNIYKGLGKTYGIPVLLNAEFMKMFGRSPQEHIDAADIAVEKIHMAFPENFKDRTLGEFYRLVLDNLVEGVNMLLVHPAFEDAELKFITEGYEDFGAHWRQEDYDFFTSAECAAKLRENDISLTSWGDLSREARK